MGTTGTIMGTSRYLKEQKPDVRIIGLQPKEGSAIAGIRRWPKEYLPTIFQEDRVDETMDISQREAEGTMRALAHVEGMFAGPSSGRAVSAAPRLSAKLTNATTVAIICDRGDRYLSTAIWKDAQHPLRKDEEVQLTGIPTLIHWTPSGPGKRHGTKLQKASSPADAEALAKQVISESSKPETCANGASS
ncbi:TPA: hypothetical protein ACH3X1_004890 [Trebouxia sp. C0004]